MTWSNARSDWPRLARRLCRDFQLLEETAVRLFRVDRAQLVLFIAASHHLTRAEAAEALDDWLRRSARPDRARAAA